MPATMKKNELKDHIRDIPDFPKEGIVFKDISTLLQNKHALKKTIDLLTKKFKKDNIDYVVAVEARGFIFGAALAYKLGAGFVPVRKPGKLPYKTHQVSYELEYGTDSLEIHIDAIKEGDRVLIIDDVLATGGTVKAVCELLKKLKANVIHIAFLMELKFLKGKEKLDGLPIYSLIKY